MIKAVKSSGHTAVGLTEFIVSTETEINDLPLDVMHGSAALCLDTSALYVFDKAKDEWVKM